MPDPENLVRVIVTKGALQDAQGIASPGMSILLPAGVAHYDDAAQKKETGGAAAWRVATSDDAALPTIVSDSEDSKLYNVAETSQLTGLTESTIRTLAKRGRLLEVVRLGNGPRAQYRVTGRSIRALLHHTPAQIDEALTGNAPHVITSTFRRIETTVTPTKSGPPRISEETTFETTAVHPETSRSKTREDERQDDDLWFADQTMGRTDLLDLDATNS